jgi:mono/diheme cytochrome c family protein
MLSVGRVSIGIFLLGLGLTGIASAANAQEGAGDLETGRALARHVCSPCHSIEPGPAAPRMFEIAPNFATIANTPGMTATALNAFLLTSHPKMPNLILSREQSADVITYILSLRTHPRPAPGNR